MAGSGGLVNVAVFRKCRLTGGLGYMVVDHFADGRLTTSTTCAQGDAHFQKAFGKTLSKGSDVRKVDLRFDSDGNARSASAADIDVAVFGAVRKPTQRAAGAFLNFASVSFPDVRLATARENGRVMGVRLAVGAQRLASGAYKRPTSFFAGSAS